MPEAELHDRQTTVDAHFGDFKSIINRGWRSHRRNIYGERQAQLPRTGVQLRWCVNGKEGRS